MKTIKLTSQQKYRLLEMCRSLFTEYDHIYLNNGKGKHGSSEHIGFGTKMGEDLIAYTYVHWFELCITHLAEKIIATYKIWEGEKIYKRTLNEDLSEFYLGSLNFSRGDNKNHPIDYLYKKFKELE